MSKPSTDLRALRPERVCLIKPSALGDVVNALPVLSSLRELWPKARFGWVVNRAFAGLLNGHPDLDEIIIYDRARLSVTPPGVVRVSRFLSELRSRSYDLAIDLQGLLRSGLIAHATGANVRVGFADAREGATLFYTDVVSPARERPHAVDRLLGLAEAFGAEVGSPRFVVPVGEADRSWAWRTLEGVAHPRVVLNLGASWVTKRWPPEHFAEIARRAVALRSAGVILVGAPGDRPIVEAFRRHTPDLSVLDLSGQTTLPQLAAIAECANVFVSNDSGPLHLAAAVGTRVVGIHTCTNHALNGAYGPNARAVSTRVWCAASYRPRCRRLECFGELTPDRVWPVVVDQLDGGGDVAEKTTVASSSQARS